MDIQGLQALLAVVDHSSFSAAGEFLHLTQPAISKRLAALESSCGHTLILRGQREIILTDAGRRLLPHARHILDELHNARQQLLSLDHQVTGQLSIIASHHIGLHHLPVWLRQYCRAFPEVSLALQFMESETALELLLKQAGEIAFITLGDSLDDRFSIYAAWEDPMCLVCGPTHPLASITQPTLADLEQHEALLPALHTETGRIINRLFLSQGLRLKAQMPTNLLETIKMMVGVGLGWSVMPLTMQDNSLHQLPINAPLSRRLGGVGLRRRRPGNAALALLEVIRQREQSQPLSSVSTSAMR